MLNLIEKNAFHLFPFLWPLRPLLHSFSSDITHSHRVQIGKSKPLKKVPLYFFVFQKIDSMLRFTILFSVFTSIDLHTRYTNTETTIFTFMVIDRIMFPIYVFLIVQVYSYRLKFKNIILIYFESETVFPKAQLS
jgi:hypothetical protein